MNISVVQYLTSVELSSSVTNICTPPFSYCKALESIRVDDDNAEYKSVDGSLYTKDGRVLVQYAAGKNDTSFVIPEGVENIGDYAFCQCKTITGIEIPSTVTSIGEGAFAECTGITEIKLPRGITAISDSMLHTCTRLTSVEIPSTVTIIGKDAFSHCLSLSKIRLPEGVTSIGSQAFYLCSSLPSIEIPSGTENIGKHAFFECSSLKIYTEEESKPSGWDDSWNSSKRPVFWDARKVLLSKLVTAINPQAGAQGLANVLEVCEQKLLKALIEKF